MDTMKVIGTRLYQWESGRKIQAIPLRGMTIDSVNFFNVGDTEAITVQPKEVGGVFIADIPNILLQSGKDIVAYSVNVSADKVETLRDCVFKVRSMAKPSDYVYTETEALNYTSLESRIAKLEKYGGTGSGAINPEAIKEAVDEYLEENPPAQGAPGKDGADGKTPVKGVDYFTPEEVQEIAEQAAQMAEVPEVNDGVTPHIGENGNWWIGDNDTGVFAGGIKGTQLANFTVEEDVQNLIIPLSDDVFNYRSLLIRASIKHTDQIYMQLRSIAGNQNIVQILHENGQVGNSSFATLVCQVDFYHQYLVTTFSTLGTYQWQSTNKYTYSNAYNRNVVADGIFIAGTVYAGSKIVVEGIR